MTRLGRGAIVTLQQEKTKKTKQRLCYFRLVICLYPNSYPFQRLRLLRQNK